MDRMYGWLGRVLMVDLNTGSLEDQALDPQVARDYIGGRGLGIYYLTRLGDPEADPLGPGNPLIMATGPLTGTYGAANGRYMVITKSPLTGTIACSNSGGYFPSELK